MVDYNGTFAKWVSSASPNIATISLVRKSR